MTLNLTPLPDDSEPGRPRVPARDRKRRYRRRQACGVVSVPVEVDGAVVDMLVTLNWISEVEAADRRQVGAAIGRLLAASATRR